MSRRRRPLSLAAASAAAAVLASSALAGFTSASSAGMTVATGTLAAPTGLTLGRGTCDVLTQDRVVVVWAETTSTFADGYEILRATAAGGPYTAIGTVSGLSTVSYTDETVAFSTTYYYVVRATRNAWRSAASSETSIKTRTSGCLV